MRSPSPTFRRTIGVYVNSCDGPVVGVLSPGDMGAHLGEVLRQEGRRVVTTVAGRGPRTRLLAEKAGLEVLDSLAAVVDAADVILSLVPCTQAVALARTCRSAWSPSSRARLFVDLNSIAPDTAHEIEAELAGSGLTFVDGAVHGVATQLRQRGVVYLSGPRADEVAELFRSALRVRVVSDRPGDASAMRMMFSGLTKGLIALFLEMALVGRQAGFLEELLTCYRETYPALMELVDRLLPSYPLHAARRADEMRELEQTMRSIGLEPRMVVAARHSIAAVGEMALEDRRSRTPFDWSVLKVIEEIFARNPLAHHEQAEAAAIASA